MEWSDIVLNALNDMDDFQGRPRHLRKVEAPVQCFLLFG